eukprot:GSChrysophyteH1.ASY1.ANO1.1533.1 assembled CDS
MNSPVHASPTRRTSFRRGSRHAFKPLDSGKLEHKDHRLSRRLSGYILEQTELTEFEDRAMKQAKYPNSVPSLMDKLLYRVENRIAGNFWFPFEILGILVVIFLFGYGAIWYEELAVTLGHSSLSDSLFLAMQVIIAADFQEIPNVNGLRVMYFLMLLSGLILVAVLIGFITDGIRSFMNELAEGRTQVALKDHTLILGWNEATPRVIIQASFLRAQYQILNEEKYYNIFRYIPFMIHVFTWFDMLERPSTSMAANDIVIMTDTLTKEEMHKRVEQAMFERGIDTKRTRIGSNIICRVGDPTNVNDLIRAGAQRASAILVMLTKQDEREEDYSDGQIRNGATLRCTLALRHIVFVHKFSRKRDISINPDLRIVLHMTSPSKFVDAASFKAKSDRDIIYPMDISIFLNSLMFTCASQPGLANVLVRILDFEGASIRRRKATNLRSGVNDEYGDCIGKPFANVAKEFTQAIFIGVVRSSASDEECSKLGLGMCPDPNTIIHEDDLLVFIGTRSNPRHSHDMIQLCDDYDAQARKLLEEHTLGGMKLAKKVSNVLLCGWRSEWEEHTDRFAARCRDLLKFALPGSSVTMCNTIDPEDFSEAMKYLGFTQIITEESIPLSEIEEGGICRYSTEILFPGVEIIHVFGDAAVPAILENIVMNKRIDTAIVLGTQADVRLNAHSRDTRVLSITLLLRKIWMIKGDPSPMHVIGENQEDTTAALALTPRATEKTRVHSSVVMAYPMIAPAVAQLFEDSAETASICNVPAFSYVPRECFELGGTLKYGVIRSVVAHAKGEISIAIGWISAEDSTVHLVPDHDEDIYLTEYDKLIIIKRSVSPEDELLQASEATDDEAGGEDDGAGNWHTSRSK